MKKKKTYKKKSPYKRKYRKQGVPAGFPTTRYAKLRYVNKESVTSSLGSLGQLTFRANSLFAPSPSGGHQPMMFDQWASLYNHYQVISCTIKCKFVEGATLAAPAIFGLYLSDDQLVPYANYTDYIEAGRGTYKYITPAYDNTSLIVKSRYDQNKFFNITKYKAADNLLGASVITSPVELAFFNLWYATVNSSTSTVRIDVTMEFICQFSEPKDVLPS